MQDWPTRSTKIFTRFAVKSALQIFIDRQKSVNVDEQTEWLAREIHGS